MTEENAVPVARVARRDRLERMNRRLVLLEAAVVITIVAVLGTMVQLAVSVSGQTRRSQATALKIEQQLRAFAEANAANIIEHRKAARCHEYEVSAFIRSVAAQFHLRFVDPVPVADLSGVDCAAELTGPLKVFRPPGFAPEGPAPAQTRGPEGGR